MERVKRPKNMYLHCNVGIKSDWDPKILNRPRVSSPCYDRHGEVVKDPTAYLDNDAFLTETTKWINGSDPLMKAMLRSLMCTSCCEVAIPALLLQHCDVRGLWCPSGPLVCRAKMPRDSQHRCDFCRSEKFQLNRALRKWHNDVLENKMVLCRFCGLYVVSLMDLKHTLKLGQRGEREPQASKQKRKIAAGMATISGIILSLPLAQTIIFRPS